ncbi:MULTISPECIES: hypothetical protein [unclassified Leptolyngbya]|uniref:hypothetical protein n=1 Tax=unclassified Leptolyngbya TaxID=2650499 RepID=UPI001683AA96|nr:MULTISPECIES: hypothetical protein [unclassified Leptolyngbya]MBD1912337.1 hypothetical protein [Leptolyngbya sp. FACHB-8]MBD2158027.1 hypothetical protein [Leptolyngbya sp. FACHB-16]
MKAYARIAGAVLSTAVLLGGGWVHSALAETLLTQDGALEEGDKVLPSDNSLYDEYTIEGQQGQTIVVNMESETFTPYLAVLDPQNPDSFVLGEGGNVPGTQSSRLEIVLPRDGQFLVIANGMDSTSRGAYTLEVSTGEASTGE